jgi:hypothetical protein
MNRKITSTVVLISTLVLGAYRGNAQTCKSKVAGDIHASIKNKYEYLTEPVFTFKRATPPPEIEAMLSDLRDKGFTVEPLTDLTFDVSFVYGLQQGKRRWRLCVSMVGPYATLFTLGGNDRKQLITDIPPNQPGYEIKQFVIAKKYKLLDKNTLNCTTKLRTPNVGRSGREVRFWQALMRDDELPW